MPEVPKKEVALKASHDKQDLVELPKFINFACDQGLLGDPDSIRPMSPKVPLPEGEKAALSTTDKTKGIAMETAIEVKVLAETEKEQKPEEVSWRDCRSSSGFFGSFQRSLKKPEELLWASLDSLWLCQRSQCCSEKEQESILKTLFGSIRYL